MKIKVTIKTTREQRREDFLSMLERYDLTRDKAAELLHVSVSAVEAWCKPETSKSSNPVPMWAIELLTFKMTTKRRTK
jgi:DNA-binding transcriptional regulator YiaG